MELKIRDTRNATEWVDDLLNGAIALMISDLQIRLNRDEELLTVRARANRVMEDVAVARGSLAVEVTNRIKAIAKITSGPAMEIADGLYQHNTGFSSHDLRVALFPDILGETLQLRLPAKQEIPKLSDIRFNKKNQRRLTVLLGMPNGLLLLAGPMGAGKTTTMYAVLDHLGGPQKNVFTVEDPVERIVPGAVQIQINEKSENGWPPVLRGLRRSDLEVLMIGEVRNGEQARAALEIGNAGAKVVSSIHANDSIGAVEQLVELSGTSPRMLGNQLRGVVSQRLLRTLHVDCAGSGCESCDRSGYKGIQPIHEVLIVDDVFVKALVDGVSTAELREVARTAGMESLWDAAHRLIAEGVTDHKEAVRVLGLEHAKDDHETPKTEETADERTDRTARAFRGAARNSAALGAQHPAADEPRGDAPGAPGGTVTADEHAAAAAGDPGAGSGDRADRGPAPADPGTSLPPAADGGNHEPLPLPLPLPLS